MLPDYRIVKQVQKNSPYLILLPVYNEMPVLTKIVEAIQRCASADLLVVDDCSSDGSFEYLQTCRNLTLIRNQENAGAGGVLLRGFHYAVEQDYEMVVTLDSDGQHNACQIHEFIDELELRQVDMVWGTRYPAGYTRLAAPFQGRQEINREITDRLNEITGWAITDSFCGFRAYRVRVLAELEILESGYGMLLELAVRAWRAGFTMSEYPVPLIYLDETRDFQEQFKNAQIRRDYYMQVIQDALVDKEADQSVVKQT